MTVQDVFEKAINLLGYTDSNGSSQMLNRMRTRAVECINSIYADLLFVLNTETNQVTKMTDELLFPDGTDVRIVREIMPYGVASLLAQGDGDGDNQQYFASVYNRKRASLSRFERIEDVIPRVW